MKTRQNIKEALVSIDLLNINIQELIAIKDKVQSVEDSLSLLPKEQVEVALINIKDLKSLLYLFNTHVINGIHSTKDVHEGLFGPSTSSYNEEEQSIRQPLNKPLIKL